MSAKGAEQDRILDEAIDLVIRLQNDPDNPVALDMLRQWRARSQMHEAAWHRVARMHGLSLAALVGTDAQIEEGGKGLNRRALLLGGLGLVGGGAVAALAGPDLYLSLRADRRTAAAELREIVTPGGDTAILGPKSALAFEKRPDRRGIELLSGMILVDAGRADLPFEATCGPVLARADQCLFAMAEDAGTIEIAVQTGTLDMQVGDWSGRVAAGNQMVLNQGAMPRVGPTGDDIAQWRQNKIAVDDISVAALSSRIGRWLPGRVVLADPFIANVRVSGVFDLADPVRALRAAVQPAGGNVVQLGPVLTLIVPG